MKTLRPPFLVWTEAFDQASRDGSLHGDTPLPLSVLGRALTHAIQSRDAEAVEACASEADDVKESWLRYYGKPTESSDVAASVAAVIRGAVLAGAPAVPK